MHALCNAEFSRAQFCSTSDIIRNGGLELNRFLFGWINPTLVNGSDLGGADIYVHATGISSAADDGGLSCNNWQSQSSGHTGLVIFGSGRIFDYFIACSFSTSIACCAPRPSFRRPTAIDPR